ncbi:MAG: TetR/AcrR family transcriptional regulator [Acetatifactor sp.]|nr:TetR/AcrR family transcriptional regulator [Acetatifactor sp.]
MEKREDRRVAMTKRMLKDALTDMLRKTDIYHVSIRELCQKADVNRTTFYKYYGSQFDLLSDMEKDLLDFLSKTITEHAANTEKIVQTACEYLQEHLEFVRLIINNNVDPMFPQKLFSLDVMRKATLHKFSGSLDEDTLEYLFNYITYGAYRIICMWLNKEQRESPEQISVLLSRFIQQQK